MSDYSGREYSEERREEDDDISINDSRKRRRSSELEYGVSSRIPGNPELETALEKER